MSQAKDPSQCDCRSAHELVHGPVSVISGCPYCCTARAANKKLERQLYRLEGLQLRMRARQRKHMCLRRGPAPAPNASREVWSIDLLHVYTMSCSTVVRFAF